MKYFYVSLLGFSLLTLMGCPQEKSALISMSYEETQCADPWGTLGSSPAAEVIESVVAFFEDKGIELENVTVNQGTPEATCAACDCPSFRTIRVDVDEMHKEEMEENRFKAD